jgi:hypothetical protein
VRDGGEEILAVLVRVSANRQAQDAIEKVLAFLNSPRIS